MMASLQVFRFHNQACYWENTLAWIRHFTTYVTTRRIFYRRASVPRISSTLSPLLAISFWSRELQGHSHPPALSDLGAVSLGETVGGKDVRGWLAETATDSDDFTPHKYTQLSHHKMNPRLELSLAASSKCQSLWSHPTPGKG